MPRRKRLRKVVAPPGFRGYRPYGYRSGGNPHIDLLYEEFEAIKLADYQLLNHQEAAVLMGISRPTFARIYESARRKIAKALVETREIRSVFGNAQLDQSWFICSDCHARFTIPPSLKEIQCPVCRSAHVEPINKEK
jgi:predicted DNA-binding protein (UPF0251 family)